MTGQAFPTVKKEVIDRARVIALEALRDPGTPQRLAEFYNPEGNYAGATFTQLEPREDNRITATDLLATGTLSVTTPPRAVRRFLEEPEVMSELSRLLEALPRVKLEDTTAQHFGVMCEFYDLVKESLAKAGTKFSNAWVTASKITARKRPELFPVRDSKVCELLGIQKLGDREKDWYVFRDLMLDPQIREVLDELPSQVRSAAGQEPLGLEPAPLRLLDAVLWRFAVAGKEEPLDGARP